MATFIRYGDDIVAVASSSRLHITLEQPTEQLRRFLTLMGRYAADVETGELPGPYNDQHAERYARAALIPDEDFVQLGSQSDEALAAHFEVPLEQIAQKRVDLMGGRP